ncbi:MAG: 2Fe-2S iron-sulfur cluster-binding protein [Burkholderiales bacterium]|nr:2Fe-2S iron-sulfur cluster-binding protein [Burkholderiales bacterium]
MTAPQLLALIVAAMLLQLGAGVGWMLWRGRVGSVIGPAGPSVALPERGARTEAAWQGLRAFRVTKREYEDAARSQCSFHLQPVDGAALPAFRPGQFLTFTLDVAAPGPDGAMATRSVTRCYSLSDAPDPTHYRVTIKRVPAPPDHPEYLAGLASNQFHDRVQVGDVLQVKAPGGNFFIDPDPNVSVVLIAGGIGITPMMSMLRGCAAVQPQRPVHLYYGVRHGREQAFKLELEALAAAHPAFRLNVVYSCPDPTDLVGRELRHAGRIDVALLQRTLPPGRHPFYVCGPPGLMQSLVPALADWGVPVADIHFEAFGPATVRLPGAAAADGTAQVTDVDIRFTRSGRTLVWDGQDATLLDFAERHGVAVESGCRSGGCGSCETRVLAGSVAYASPPDHAPAAGHCLLCVGRPASPLVLEA